MNRPLIGVTSSARRGWLMTRLNRFALWRAGARSVVMTSDSPRAGAELDGLLIGGGDDIEPTLYKGGITLDIRIDPERDRLEKEAFETAERRGLPVLGICRGSQMINVMRGGSLHEDIHAVYEAAPRMRTVLPRKQVTIEPDSRLGRILGADRCRVNCLHHQSVDRLGDGMAVVAQDDHGIVQAVESGGPRFVVGVQWHPEFLLANRAQQGLFRHLAAAADGHCGG